MRGGALKFLGAMDRVCLKRLSEEVVDNSNSSRDILIKKVDIDVETK